MRTAEQNVYEMLIEDTGKALLDSGGHYGRHWEQNQGKTLKDFESAPSVTLEFDNETEELDGFTIDVFHYLVGGSGDSIFKLEVDDVCEKFNAINVGADNWGFEEISGVSSEAGEYLKSLGLDGVNEFNTYNGETALSQVLQGAHIETDGGSGDYMILQVHGGCDIRGGYTDARMFYIPDDSRYLPRESITVQLNIKQEGQLSFWPIGNEEGSMSAPADTYIDLSVDGCVEECNSDSLGIKSMSDIKRDMVEETYIF